ncbi:cell death-inducing p53-target protein 1 homolog isoform X2 [Pecten maximus]|uniref:cell death-inducing p53-target protein 1 homolog isoform X2 n=1 Tax=Pecten maximus TaxID=6579 RepID=UPI001457EF34|nr:cell death-inducing p53-target protein 1 homolog isoform X2 [Pecten maximus]
MDKSPPYPPTQPGYPSPPQQGYPQAPPPQQGYPQQGAPPPYSQPPQQQHSGATTVVVNAPQTTFGAPILREMSVRCTCPHCRADIMTSTTYTSGSMVWLAFLLMFFFGFWLCCFIPFCMDGCKDVVHNCPNCGGVVGRYNRM